MKIPSHIITTLVVIPLLFHVNCSSTKQGIDISLDPELNKKESVVGSAWLSYGMNKALWRTKNKSGSDTIYTYTFTEEVDCRKKLSDMWLELKEKDPATDAYLDELSTIVKAGYISEYVWKYLHQPGWTKPSDLKDEEFNSWIQQHIPNHNCITLSTATSHNDKKPTTENQMSRFTKAINHLQNGRMDKAETILKELSSYTPEGWKCSYSSGDTLYCAFWDKEEQQQCIKLNPDISVVPIYPSFSQVYYFLGFIALEKEDANSALEYLNKASELQPDHPTILLEKGNIFSSLGQLQNALNCFQEAEKPHYSSTPNIQARALRGQGVTLIDLGNIDEAEKRLENSLKYDPSSQLAVNELEYIRRIRSGESNPGAETKLKKINEK
jgi:tetratricopeptide (TPR) repeat protein